MSALVNHVLMNFISDRQVVDETGQGGEFDFVFIIPTATLHASGGGDEVEKPAAFFRGVQQLGLKLIPKREPLNVMVIDHVEQPTPN